MSGNFSEIIVDKFSTKFTAAYKGLSGSGKSKILKYSPVIFKRWYYSTLIDETTLSPSFIYAASLGVSSSASALSVAPVDGGSRFKGFSIKENKYTVSNHPIVNDLCALVDFCAPDIELDEYNNIESASAKRLSYFLSLRDPYYLEYLTAIAFEMKLLKKSDAIYSNKAVISDNYTLFRKLNQEAALKKIVDVCVRLCSKRINGALPEQVSFFSEKGVVALIKKPVTVDEIFKMVFGSFGVDIEQLWIEYNENGQAAEQSEMLSSTFFLGVLLDKWFITPFSRYLMFIEPVYCYCYNFDEELNYLYDVIKTGGIVDTALYSPCAFYSFTPFGRIFFASDTLSERNKTRPIPVSELLGLLNYDAVPSKAAIGDKAVIAKDVYSFKVKRLDDKRYWKTIEAADYNTLHELHLEIALNFGFGLSRYSIFTDESMNLFCEFVCPKTKGRQRKADKVTLGGLDLIKGKKMVYISDTGRKLEIEVIKRDATESKEYYPRKTKESKHFGINKHNSDKNDL